MFTKVAVRFQLGSRRLRFLFNHDEFCQGKGLFKSCICFLVLMLTVSAAVTACCYEYTVYISIYFSMHLDAF